MPLFGYPTLVIVVLIAYLRASEATRPFVRFAFLVGVAGMSGALSGAVSTTGSVLATAAQIAPHALP
jgi:hypothetical protein